MRDFTGRELVKLSEVKEGDTLEVRTGAVNYLDGGTYTVEKGIWGLVVRGKDGVAQHYLDYMPQRFDDDGAAYIEGVYYPQTEEPTVSNSPLSEDEMRAFFERMVTTIVGYSKQAEELKAVQDNLAELNEKFSRQSEAYVRLEAHNQNLQNQVHQLDEVIRGKNKQLDDVTAERDLYVENNAKLHRDIADRDVEIAALKEDKESYIRANDDLARTLEDRDREVAEKNEQIKLIMSDRDEASRLYSETRDKLVEAERKLTAIQNLFRSTQESLGNVVNF